MNNLKTPVYVLKRSNGFYGIFVGGKKQENLQCNSCLKDHSNYMFDYIKYELDKLVKNKIEYEVVFTTNEDEFKSGLPSLEQYLTSMEG